MYYVNPYCLCPKLAASPPPIKQPEASKCRLLGAQYFGEWPNRGERHRKLIGAVSTIQKATAMMIDVMGEARLQYVLVCRGGATVATASISRPA